MDYSNLVFRFVDIGLSLRDEPSTLPLGKWSKLDNVRPIFESRLETRPGRSLQVDVGSSAIHSANRLDDQTLVVGASTSVYRNDVLLGSGFSGNPLAFVNYRDAFAGRWTYLGDRSQMRKVRADGTFQKWGITEPQASASPTVASSGSLDSSVTNGIAYRWRYTYRNSVAGSESNPSLDMIAGLSLTNKSASVVVEGSTDPQVDTVRLYRYGGSINTWRLTKEAANQAGQFTILDDSSDASILNRAKMQEDNYVPFTTIDASGTPLFGVPLPYVWGPTLGDLVFACGDTNRPGFVYWTNPSRPDSTGLLNLAEITSPHEPLQNGFIYSGVPYTLSRQNVYALDFGSNVLASTSIQGRLTPVGRGLASPWGLVVGPLVFFVSTDGIYATDCNTPAVSLTEDDLKPIFLGKDSGDFKAVDFTKQAAIRLCYSGQDLHFFYQGSDAVTRHLILDTVRQRWRSSSSVYGEVRVAFSDDSQSARKLFFGLANGKLVYEDSTATTDVGSAITATIESGILDLDLPNTDKEWGGVLVEAKPPAAGAVTVTLTEMPEGVATTRTLPAGGSARSFTVPLPDLRANGLKLGFSWAGLGHVTKSTLLWRPQEELLQHWAFQPTANGLQGWQHIRDGYFALESTVAVTLTLTLDGVAYTYSLPSTGGVRKKLYVAFKPVRFKMISYALDVLGQPTDGAGFYLFGEDCEINVKSWNSAKGYQTASPFVQGQGGT